MKAQFNGKKITAEIRNKYPENQILIDQDYHLNQEGIYTVLALRIKKNGAIIIHCVGIYNNIGFYPIDFFKLIDCRVSKYWLIQTEENGDVTFFPQEYYDNKYFHDDLSEDDPETVRQFHDLLKRFKEEY